MAANTTAESVLGKISKDHLECPICMKCYTQPKLLDCLHSFCLNCLQEMRDMQDKENRTLTCPVCRHVTILTEKEVAGLPNDFKLSALVEEVTMQEKLLQGQGSEIKCQACDEGNRAISRCMDCDHFLCQECQRAHERMAVMKSHQIYTLAQLQSGEVTYKSKLRDFTPKCETHIDQNISLYCNTCEKLVCVLCSVLDHVNPKHSLVDLPEAVKKCKQDVAQLMAKVMKSKTELNNALSATEKSRKNLDSMYADTNKKISRKADKEVTKIREEERKLKQEAEKIYKDRVKTFEIARSKNSKEATQAVNKLDKVNRLMDHCEILALQQKLFDYLKELTEIQPQKVSDRLSFMDFEEGEGSLGRLVLEDESNIELKAAAEESLRPGSMCLKEKWALKTDIKRFGPKQTKFKWANHVASFSNNEIIVVDTTHKLLITFTPESKSQSTVIPQRLQIKGLTVPRRIAVNRDDQLIVLDYQTVKIFNKKYQLLYQVTPGRGSDSQPSCLAVDDNNLIAVGYQENKEISLHNPDGSLIKTLPAPGIGHYLTTCKQQFIYTDWRKKLVSVDYNGVMVFSVDVTSDRMSQFIPTGVCCDTDGSIYVAVCDMLSLSGDIQRFSPDGKYIECVIKDCSPPRGITFTPGGDLVVAAYESVQIYHRV